MAKGTKGWRILKAFGAVVVLWALATVGILLYAIHCHDDINGQIPILQPQEAVASSIRTSDRHHRQQDEEQRRKILINELRDDIKKIRNRLVSDQKLGGGYPSNHNQETLPRHHEAHSHFNRNNTLQRRHYGESKTKPRTRTSSPWSPTQKKPVKPLSMGEIAITGRKHFDTQGRPVICVERNVTTSRCQLHPCQHTMTNPTDEYGFIVHQHNNTRGRRMAISGSAVSGSGCAISHTYKFVYIHVLKSGGMTVKTFLKRGLCGMAASCEALKIVNCAKAIIDYPDYFSFSFVRNPFDRMYSAYSMAESMKGQSNFQWNFQDFVLMNKTLRRRFTSYIETSQKSRTAIVLRIPRKFSRQLY
jgi:Sulfotransferase family